MKEHSTRYLLVVLAAFLATHCVASSCDSPATLTGASWTAIAIRNKGSLTPVLNNTKITANFTDSGKLLGSSGCNSYSGQYKAGNSSFVIPGRMSVSLKYCTTPAKVMAQEDLYLSTLSAATNVSINCTTLDLLDKNGTVLVSFGASSTVNTKASCSNSYGFVGTNWTALQIADSNGSLSRVVPGTNIDAVFTNDGMIMGSSACNNTYEGAYNMTGSSSIAIDGRFSVSGALCLTPPGALQQSENYIQALFKTTSFDVTCDRLDLLDRNGNVTATFVAEQPNNVVSVPPTTNTSASTSNATTHIVTANPNSSTTSATKPPNTVPSVSTHSSLATTLPTTITSPTSVSSTNSSTMSGCPPGGNSTLTSTPAANQSSGSPTCNNAPLEGTEWIAFEVFNGSARAATSIIAGTQVTMLMNGGKVAGFAGCHKYTGTYQSTGTIGLIFGNNFVVTTKKCTGPVSQQEDSYLSDLWKTTVYEISCDVLKFYNKFGKVMASFRASASGTAQNLAVQKKKKKKLPNNVRTR